MLRLHAAGRVQFYQGSIYNGGAIIDANTPTESALTETASVMDSYDVILFPCQGLNGSYTAANGWPNGFPEAWPGQKSSRVWVVVVRVMEWTRQTRPCGGAPRIANSLVDDTTPVALWKIGRAHF